MKYIPLIIGLLLMVLLCWVGASAQTRYSHKTQGVCLSVKALLIDEDTLCYVLQLSNHSPLSYTIGLLRYAVKDRKVIRRHAYQEIPKTPLWVKGYKPRVDAGQLQEWKVAFLPEAFSRDQCFEIDVYERHGARNLRVSVNWKKLMKARFVNEL
jgi:hypothetical protein